MTILVTGASGGVGRHVLDMLIAGGHPVRASSRDPQKARLPAGVSVVAADLNAPETLPAALAGVSRVFLYAQEDGIDAFVAAAVAAGVEHVVLLSSASVVLPGKANFIAERHLVVERALAASGLAWTFVRPGAFSTNALGWAHSIRAEGVVRIPYPNAHQTPIHEADIAAVAVAALTGRELMGKAPVLSGPESLTLAQEIERIGEAIGKPIRIEELSPEQARQAMGQRMPAPIVETLLEYWASSNGVPQPVSDEVERITGRPARTFAQWAREHADAFR
jgi:uncharacterized protein YbjT (DUF2867 family)